MAEIHSAAAEIRTGKKKERKKEEDYNVGQCPT